MATTSKCRRMTAAAILALLTTAGVGVPTAATAASPVHSTTAITKDTSDYNDGYWDGLSDGYDAGWSAGCDACLEF